MAAYEPNLIATDAPFQQYVNGDDGAISDAAKRGFKPFRGKAQCVTCHTPPLTTNNQFHNIGVPQVGTLKKGSRQVRRHEEQRRQGQAQDTVFV